MQVLPLVKEYIVLNIAQVSHSAMVMATAEGGGLLQYQDTHSGPEVFKVSVHVYPNGLLHFNSIQPLWKVLEKCITGGVWISKYTHLLCDF